MRAAHAQGIYENQRKSNPDKRVLNPTRSGYASSQKFGTVLWSGDIFASWDTMKKQIHEGLNMCMSGMPYWTLDIGGFLYRKRKLGSTEAAPAARIQRQSGSGEGITRKVWMITVTESFMCAGLSRAFFFLCSVHMVRTLRGRCGILAGRASLSMMLLVKNIELRYRLMPYIYSNAARSLDG